MLIKLNKLSFLYISVLIFFIISSCIKKKVTYKPIDDTKAFECNGQYFAKLNKENDPATTIVEINNNEYLLNNESHLTKVDSTGNVLSEVYLEYSVSHIFKTNDDNLLISLDYNSDGYTNEIRKTDNEFNSIWSFLSKCNTIITTSDNGCIIVYDQNEDFLYSVNKFNSDGNNEWNFNVEMRVNNIMQLNSAEFILAGVEETSYGYEPCLLKVDSAGTTIWKRAYMDMFDNYDEITHVLLLSSGNLVCVFDGYKESTNINFFSTDSEGNVLWKSTLPEDYEFNDIINQESSFIFCSKQFFEDSRFDAVLTKYNSSGSIIWEKNYGGTGDEEVNDIIISSDGAYFVLASSTNFIFTNTDTEIKESMYLIKTDEDGKICY